MPYCTFCKKTKDKAEFLEFDKKLKRCSHCRKYFGDYRKKDKEKINLQNQASKRRNWTRVIVENSRKEDKKRGRYPEDDSGFITREFIEDLWKDQEGICIYAYLRDDCCAEMQTENRKLDNGCTVERLNNDIGHLKTNCVLCCCHCNNRSHGKNFWN